MSNWKISEWPAPKKNRFEARFSHRMLTTHDKCVISYLYDVLFSLNSSGREAEWDLLKKRIDRIAKIENLDREYFDFDVDIIKHRINEYKAGAVNADGCDNRSGLDWDLPKFM